MKFYTNIDLNKNQLKNVVIDNITTDLPASGVEGQFIYLKKGTADDGLYVYNGTAWKPVAFGTTFYASWPTEATNFVAGDTLLRTSPETEDLGIWISKTKHSIAAGATWASDKDNWALLESNTFKGPYVADTNYAVGDIVSWGTAGSAYMCHTACASPATITDIGPDSSKWYLLGANYRGKYADLWPTSDPGANVLRYFSKGDVVSHNGITYLCKESYSATLATGTDPWEAPAFDDTKYVALGGGDVFKGTFSDTSTYIKGDVVYHDNQLFHCNTDITTAAVWDATKWDLLLSDDWRGEFTVAAVPSDPDKTYKPGEKVSYGGNLYICTANTDNSGWDKTKWVSVAANIEIFDDTKNYKAGTLVKTVDASGNVEGVFITAEDIAAGTFDASKWHSLYNDYRYTWTYKNAYKIGDEVAHDGGIYIAIADQAASATAVDFDASKWYKLGNAQYRGNIVEVDATTKEIKLTAAVEYGDIFTDGTNILEATAQLAKGAIIGNEGSGTPVVAAYRDYTNLRFLVRQKVEVELQNSAAGTAAVVQVATIPYGCIVEEVETGIIDTTATPNTKTLVVVEKLYTDEDATSHTGAKIQFTAILTSDGTTPSEKITCRVYYR